jgi:hypothetical protein
MVKKHILLALIKDKRKVPEETHRLKVLVKWVTELHQAGLEEIHCDEEFTLRRIRPLGHGEKLDFECLRFADLSHNPTVGKTLIFTPFLRDFIFNCDMICCLYCLAPSVEEVAHCKADDRSAAD